MLAAALSCIATGSSFEVDLQEALVGIGLKGHRFHHVLAQTMAGHGLNLMWDGRGRGGVRHTLGDAGGIVLWTSDIKDEESQMGFNTTVYFIWKDGTDYRVQRLPGLAIDFDRRTIYSVPYFGPSELVFAGDAWQGGNWTQPGIWVYRKRSGTWNASQYLLHKLGESCLPGTRFQVDHGRVDPNVVVALTRVYPKYLMSPHVGPLMHYDLRFRRAGGRYVEVYRRLRPTPLAELDFLAGLRKGKQLRSFNARVPRRSRKALWDALAKGSEFSDKPWVGTTSNLVDDEARILVVGETQVCFARHGGSWRVAWCRPDRSD